MEEEGREKKRGQKAEAKKKMTEEEEQWLIKYRFQRVLCLFILSIRKWVSVANKILNT